MPGCRAKEGARQRGSDARRATKEVRGHPWARRATRRSPGSLAPCSAAANQDGCARGYRRRAERSAVPACPAACLRLGALAPSRGRRAEPAPRGGVVASRARGPAHTRAAIGCLSLGAGILALAFIPRPSTRWLIVPEILAGPGMGLALPRLANELLPEPTSAQANRLLATRHVGIALTLSHSRPDRRPSPSYRSPPR
jgi:hypothetical protein